MKWNSQTALSTAAMIHKVAPHNEFLSLFQKPVAQKFSMKDSYRETSLPRSSRRSDLISSVQSPGVKKQEKSFGTKPTELVRTSSLDDDESLADEDHDIDLSTPGEEHQFENPLLEQLVSRLRDSVIIRDQAVETPTALQLSDGYVMDGEVIPADHYQALQEVKMHVKRKRREGILSKPARRQRAPDFYGYRPQDLNYKGAVSLHDCRPSDLANDIHPLLVRARFDDTPDAIYNELVPALRLASLFLTRPICMQFWVTMAFGERIDDIKMSRKHSRRCQRIPQHVTPTHANTLAVIKHLHELGSKGLIHFRFKTKLLHNKAWGCSGPIYDYGHSRMTRSVVRLHSDYYTVAKKLSKLKYPEASQKLRFSFLFAVLLLHELVSGS